MIHYSLLCENRHAFDAWFKSAAAFDEQVQKGIVTCPMCSTRKVQKSLMAPAVSRSSEPARAVQEQIGDGRMSFSAGHPQQAQLRAALKQLRDKVTTEADYVGDQFASEARRIHFREVEPHGIYGEATQDEVAGMVEDGIDFMPLPHVPEDHN